MKYDDRVELLEKKIARLAEEKIFISAHWRWQQHLVILTPS